MKSKMWAYYLPLTSLQPKTFDVNDGGRCLKQASRNFDKTVWDDTLDILHKNKSVNTVVIAVRDGMIYETHPDIALEGAWTKEELYDEISRLRSMGLNVYPLLDFSAGHNNWMGVYSRMVSTPQYYSFCEDVINEISEVFSNPELFHLGMDEECLSIQEAQSICIIRNSELYWHDINHLFGLVEKNGSRPWIWADYVWHTKKRETDFLENMTKDALLSNWYYQRFTDPEDDWHYPAYKAFELLDKHGFDQVPTGSNFVHRDNFELLVDHCVKHISDENLKGFMIASWRGMVDKNRDHNKECANVISEVYSKYCGK